MALTIKDELSLVWRSLARSEAGEGWRKIGIVSLNSMQVMAGVCNPGGYEAILISFKNLTATRIACFPQSRGFNVAHEKFEGDDKVWITITRSPLGALDLFLLMAVDIIEYLKSSENITDSIRYQSLLGRIKAWQHFMKQGRDGLTLEEELGLAGEIVVFDELVKSGLDIDTVLATWVGPENGLQDFEIGMGAIEVKSTLAEIDFPAKIFSLEQLDDSQRKPLLIAGCRFSLADSGKTLPDFIKLLEDSTNFDIRKIQLLELKLIAAGYHHSHAERYTRKMIVSELSFWLVDSIFPRLVAGNVPSEVRSVNYTIDLSFIRSKIDSLDTVLKMLKGK